MSEPALFINAEDIAWAYRTSTTQMPRCCGRTHEATAAAVRLLRLPPRRAAARVGRAVTAPDCGCANFDGHAPPTSDPIMGLFHGERSDLNGDPPPDGWCLCGHPDYMTCASLDGLGSLRGLIVYAIDGQVGCIPDYVTGVIEP